MTTELDNNTLEWAAQWIEGSLKGEPDQRVREFGKNMAMTLRAARLNAAPVVSDGDDEGEGDVRVRLESIAEPWICAEEKTCEEAVPVHWNEMITALVAARRSK